MLAFLSYFRHVFTFFNVFLYLGERFFIYVLNYVKCHGSVFVTDNASLISRSRFESAGRVSFSGFNGLTTSSV